MAEVSRLLGDQIYLVGDAVSLADLLIAPQLYFLAQTPEWGLLAEGASNLEAYVERIEGRPSMQATTWARVKDMAEAA